MILTGRVAFITGSTSGGMGRSIAFTLARNGADIVLNYGTNRSDAEADKESKLVENAIREMGSYSGAPASTRRSKNKNPLPYQTERQQALDYLKRFVYPLSRGVDKIFPAFGLMEGFKHDDGYFDHTGLIYDGEWADDPGLGVKKLSYYTYKLMTEKLEGSDWNNIEIIQESDNIYVYKFIKNGEPVWVVWWDYFDDDGSSKTVTLNVGNLNSVKITEAVPDAESGIELNEGDYPNFFRMETKTVSNGQVTITLGESPIFVEGK